MVLLESLERGRADNTKLEKAHGRSVAAVGTPHSAGAKGAGKKRKNGQKGGTKQGAGGNKTHLCHCCGSTKHKGGFLEWKEKCKLFDNKFTKCGRLGHSEKYCHRPTS